MTSIKLKQLLPLIPDAEVKGNKDITICGVANHSQAVGPGFIFIARRGKVFDANAFVPEAIRSGAACIVSDTFDPSLKGVTQIITSQMEEVEAALSHGFWGHPTKELSVIGITGTSGKTTTSYLLRHILAHGNRPCGLIGTIEYAYGAVQQEAKRTTPDVVSLVKLFAKMKQAGMRACVMEVASHACVQRRIEGIHFQGGIFTNLSHEHLDYHKTMDEYARAKKRFFDQLGMGNGSFAVVNKDDPYHALMVQDFHNEVFSYSIEDPKAHLYAHSFTSSPDKMTCTLDVFQKPYHFETRLLGRYNIMNSMAALAAAYAVGVPIEVGLEAMTSFLGAPGRLEKVPNALGITAVVDYSHKENALRNVLQALRDLKPRKIITVFGCGGDRDRLKRPLMARAAEEYSDWVIVTSDNPRSEEPKEIIKEICIGFQGTNWNVVESRRDAIESALRMASKEDIVLIAGKGHEKGQIFQQVTYPFDDVEETRCACERIAAEGKNEA